MTQVAFDEVAPVISVRDLERALDRYRSLGFDVEAYDGPERYGYVRRGKLQLHLTESAEHDPHRDGAVVYLYVSDADALHTEWKAAGVIGRLVSPRDTPYGLREFAFVDPDGTAHRVGSPLRNDASSMLSDEHPMPRIRRFDHVCITVADLDAATAFFVGLGFEIEGRTVLEGEFVDTVIGIPNSRTEIVMLRPPDGGTGLELSSFLRPGHEPGSPGAMANELGLRNIAFEVDDLETILDRLAAEGYRLVGGLGQYEDVWRMAHVRGPEGIIVSLAQRIG